MTIPTKFLRTLQNECNLVHFINLAESIVRKHSRLQSIVINVLNRFPWLRNTIYSLKCNPDNFHDQGYISGENDFLSDAFPLKHTQNYIHNLKYKNVSFKKNFDELIMIGDINGYHSLSSINRNIIFKLLGRIGKISMIVYHYSYFDKLDRNSLFESEYKKLKSIDAARDVSPNKDRVALYHHYPVISDTKGIYGCPIAIFFWEESRIPREIITTLHTKYKGVIVASYFIKNVLINNGCVAPIKVAAIPLKELVSSKNDKKERKDSINLLHVSSCLPRKGVDILLKAFNAACKVVDFDMTLSIKTFINPHNSILDLVDKLVDPIVRNQIKIIFDEDLTAEDMARLYDECDIVVLPTRGEGLNMPAIEAAYLKKPLIVTNFGAQCEFLGPPVRFIEYKFAKASTHFDLSHSVWAEPSVDSLLESIVTLSKEVLSNSENLLKDLNKQKQVIRNAVFSEKNTTGFISSISALKAFKAPEISPRIAMVSSFNAVCGIAEYSKYIISHLENVEIFSWNASSYGSNIKQILQHRPLENLQTEANIIWLQHHFAFYHLDGSLQKDIISLKDQGKLLVITLHSTQQSFLYKREVQDVLLEFDKIFVHNIDDMNHLKTLGIVDNVILMPHGTQPVVPGEKNDMFTIGFFGLLFKHKNIETLLRAFSKFLTIKDAELVIFSALVDETSKDELRRYQNLAKELEIEDNIKWHTDFLPINDVSEVLATCNVIVLPYLQNDESASGAARVALSCCEDVIVSPARIFDELRDITIEAKGYESDNIFNCLKELLQEKRDEIRLQNRKKWLKEHDWSNISGDCLQIFKAMLLDREFMKHLEKKR